jgi:hypothetical protein
MVLAVAAIRCVEEWIVYLIVVFLACSFASNSKS